MNTSNATTVTTKGQVTIPAEIREHLGIKPKDRVRFNIGRDGSVTIAPTRSHVLASFGAVKAPGGVHKDDATLRREFEEGVAADALRRG
jgi:AbrB family looped-hinge helix DNA binding protein